MRRIIDSIAQVCKGEESAYKQQRSVLITKRDKLEERYAFGNIEHDTFIKYTTKLDHQISEIESKFISPVIDISNLKSNLNKAVDFTQNVSKY